MSKVLWRVGGGVRWLAGSEYPGGGNPRLRCVSLLLKSALFAVLLSLAPPDGPRPAMAALGVEVLDPDEASAGAVLFWSVRVTQTDGSPSQSPTKLTVKYDGEVMTEFTDFTFYDAPGLPGTRYCGFGGMLPGHSEESPSDHVLEAVLQYGNGTGCPNGSGTISDSSSYSLDNYTPTEVTPSTPAPMGTSPLPYEGTLPLAFGMCAISAIVVPAPHAGDGFLDDYIDRVRYACNVGEQELTHQEGYWDENWQWVESDTWYGEPVDSAMQDSDGDPLYRDGVYEAMAIAFFGPNQKRSFPNTYYYRLQNQGLIKGTVHEKVTGEPMGGITVEAVRYFANAAYDPMNPDPNVPASTRKVFQTTTTAADGTWEFTLYPATYSIEAKGIDYVTGKSCAGLAPRGLTEGVDIQLERRVVLSWMGQMQPGGNPGDGITPVHVTATVRTQDGDPAPDGTVVNFTASRGQLSASSAQTTIDWDGQARATVDLTPPLLPNDFTIDVDAESEGAHAITLSIPFKGVKAQVQIVRVGREGASAAGGNAPVDVKVIKTENVTLTEFRLRCKEDTQAHPADWTDIFQGCDMGQAPVVEEGQDYKVYRLHVSTYGLHNFAHVFKAEAHFSTTGPLPVSEHEVTASVKNLVITAVQTGAGNEDYVKFDPSATEGQLAYPSVNFTIEDDGDPCFYRWTLWARDTRNGSWVNWTTTEGETGGPEAVTTNLNNPDAMLNALSGDANAWPKQWGALTDWGTYAFDLLVEEIDAEGSPTGDAQYLKYPYLLTMPTTMTAVVDELGNPMPGHRLYFDEDEQGAVHAKADYYLEDAQSFPATSVTIDLLSPSLMPVVSRGGLGTASGTPYLGNDLATLSDQDGDGTYIGVFMAEDAHGMAYRDHRNKRMLAVNQRRGPQVFHIEDDWMLNGPMTYDAQARAPQIKGAFKAAGWMLRTAGSASVLSSACTPLSYVPELDTSGERDQFSRGSFHTVYYDNRNSPVHPRNTFRYVHVIGASWQHAGNTDEMGLSYQPERWSYTWISSLGPLVSADDIRKVTLHEVGHHLGADDEQVGRMTRNQLICAMTLGPPGPAQDDGFCDICLRLISDYHAYGW